MTIAAGVLFWSSCSPSADSSKPVYTGTNITRAEIIQKIGDRPSSDKYTALVYEVVDQDWLLKTYHDIFWKRLFADNITKWDERANCAIFTEEYVGGLQKAYYRDHFQSSTSAVRLAVGEFWYLPNPSDFTVAHSVVIVVTNRGVIYLEPQSKDRALILNLTPEQIATRFLRKI